jgi:hypothetical protein
MWAGDAATGWEDPHQLSARMEIVTSGDSEHRVRAIRGDHHEACSITLRFR